MPSNSVIQCYDIGGTNLRAAIISGGEFLVPPEVVASEKGDVDELLLQVERLSHVQRKKASITAVDAVVLAVPGPVAKGYLLNSPPLDLTEAVHLPSRLSSVFEERNLIVGNDLAIAAYGEISRGLLGDNQGDFCLVSISTGIGVALARNHMVIPGNFEIGHIIVEFDEVKAQQCLNHRGCWASHVAGFGLSMMLREENIQLDLPEFFASDVSQQFMPRLKEYNARGFAQLINAYDPQVILVTGSLGLKQFEKIIPEKDEISKYCLFDKIPPIVKSTLGEYGGLWGAYYYGLSWLCEKNVDC